MTAEEPHIFSFIVKIWMESPAGAVDPEGLPPTARARWHGQVTHVPSGSSLVFRDLERLPWFVGQYLSGGMAGGGDTAAVRPDSERRE